MTASDSGKIAVGIGLPPSSRKLTTSTDAVPRRSRSIKADSLWSLVGTTIFTAGQWSILVVPAKWGSTSDIGEFALATAICNPLFFFLSLQLRNIVATDAKRELPFGVIVRLRLLLSVLGMVAVFGLALSRMLVDVRPAILVTVGFMRFFDSLSDIYYGSAQQNHNFPAITWSQILRGVTAAVVVAPVIWITGNFAYGLAAVSVAWAAVLLLFDVPNADSNSRAIAAGAGPITRDSIFAIFSLGIPLGFVYGLTQLIDSVPRFAIDRFLGPVELGAFAAMGYLLACARILIGAVGQSALPRLASLYSRNQWKDFSKLLVQLELFAIGLGISGIVLTSLVGRSLLRIVYNDEIAQRSGALIWIMFAATLMFAGTFLGQAMTAARNIRSQVFVTLFMVGVECLVSWLLVPTLGLVGAALAMAAAGLLQCISFAVLLIRDVRRNTGFHS